MLPISPQKKRSGMPYSNQPKKSTSTSASRFFQPPPPGLSAFPYIHDDDDSERHQEDSDGGSPVLIELPPPSLVSTSQPSKSLKTVTPAPNTPLNSPESGRDLRSSAASTANVVGKSEKRRVFIFEDDMYDIGPDAPYWQSAPQAKTLRQAASIRALAPNSHSEIPEMKVSGRFWQAELQQAMRDELPKPSAAAAKAYAQNVDGGPGEKAKMIVKKEQKPPSAEPLGIHIQANEAMIGAEAWSLVEDLTEFRGEEGRQVFVIVSP